jgi:hypothetical protein
MVDRNRILQIGKPGSEKIFGRSGRMYLLFESLNMNEFEVVIWDMASSIDIDSREIVEFNHRSLNTPEQLTKFRSAYKKFGDELLEWVLKGGILIIFPMRFKALTAKGHEVDLTATFPLNYVNPNRLSGLLVDIASSEFSWLTPFCQFLKYENVFEGSNLNPLFVSSNSRPGAVQVVGGYVRHGDGVIVFPPLFSNWAALPGFVDAIAILPKKIKRVAIALPEWTGKFLSSGERKVAQAVSALEEKIGELSEDIFSQKQLIVAEQNLKHLFASSGDEFQDAVMAALSEFRLKVVKGPHPRADLLITDGRRLVAAEVKGLEGSVREGNHRQVIRWMAETNATLAVSPNDREGDPELEKYAEALGKLGIDVSKPRPELECRGLMVIGTYRNTPLDQRTIEDFPDPVKRGIERTPVCALTGLQLYCLLQQCRSGAMKRETVIAALFEKSGVLDIGLDWRSIVASG